MQIRVSLTDDERRELRVRAARLGVSGEDYNTAALRLGAHALDASTTSGSVPIIGKTRRGFLAGDLPNPFNGAA